MEAIERETVISWNDAEDTVNVFTCHKRIIAKMEKLGAIVKDKCVLNGRLRHIEYEIPKSRINVTLSAKRTLSDEQKQRLGERMRANIGKP